LVLEFDDGEIKTVDLEKRLWEWSQASGSKFRALLDPEYFKSIKLNKELEHVYWDNGIDFSPNSLHMWAVEQEHDKAKKEQVLDKVI
jgi:hypothetical protein